VVSHFACLFVGSICLQLESLKKGESIHKDDDGVTLLANTYDPDVDPKSAKSNKQRQRQREISSKYSLSSCTELTVQNFCGDITCYRSELMSYIMK